MLIRFAHFKHSFSSSLYKVTLLCLVHLFKFKKPDSTLFSRYLATLLPFMQKHTFFLVFLKKVLYTLQKFFKFEGVKVIISGKLNGFSRAQSKKIQVGCIPLQTLSIPHDKSSDQAFTSSGKIGIKV